MRRATTIAAMGLLWLALPGGTDGTGSVARHGSLPSLVAPAAGTPHMTSELAGGFEWMHMVGYGPLDAEPVTYVPSMTIPAPEPTVPPYDAATVFAASWPAQLTEADVDHIYELADVPPEWRADLKRIAWAESRWSPGAVGDSGSSLGLHQLWQGWAQEGEDLMDPVTNARVAVRVRAIRGRYGGAGGWSVAQGLGLP